MTGNFIGKFVTRIGTLAGRRKSHLMSVDGSERLISLSEEVLMEAGANLFLSNLFSQMADGIDTIHLTYNMQENGIFVSFGSSLDGTISIPYGVMQDIGAIQAYHDLSGAIPAGLRFVRTCTYPARMLPGCQVDATVVVGAASQPEEFPDDAESRGKLLDNRYRVTLIRN